MKFKVDENLPIEVAQLFKDAGFEADTVYDEGRMEIPTHQFLMSVDRRG